MSLAVRSFLRLALFKPSPRRTMCHFNKELLKAQPPAPDILFQNLKIATSTKSVLDIVASHHEIMNNKHLLQALRTLFTLQKYGNSDMSTQQILKQPEFEKLCQHLKAQARTIELNDTIEALKVVCYVGVSADSTIIQVLLQLLRYNINELSLAQIIFLDFLVARLKKTPLVEAMQIVLPIVFEIQLATKMDRHSVTRLAEYLQYVSKKNISDRCIESIVESLLRCEEGMDGKTAYSVVWSICDMKPHEFFAPLLKKAVDSLIVNVDGLSYREIETTLAKMIYNYSPRTPFYYSEVFCDVCAHYVIDNDLGFNHAVYLLRKFTRVSHFNGNLLNYVSEKAQEDPNLILFGLPTNIYTLIVSLAMTDVRPKNWEALKTGLEGTTVFANCPKKDIVWVKLAASLCALDIYKADVLGKVAKPDTLQGVFKKRIPSDFENLLTVNQAVRTFRPEHSDLLPEKEAIENAIVSLRQNVAFPLEASLQKALGGEVYVKTKLLSKLGHQIDHVVLFRKGGYPVAFSPSNKDAVYVEDVEKPPDSHIVIIQALGPMHYTLNTKRMRGTTLLGVRTLEAKNYTVVPIRLEAWEALHDFERIPYIMQAIKEATNNYSLEIEGYNVG